MLVGYWNSLKQHSLAWTFGYSVISSPRAVSGFLYSVEIHQWKLIDEVCIAGYWVGKESECLRMYSLILSDKNLTEYVRKHLKTNKEFMMKRVKQNASDKIKQSKLKRVKKQKA